MAAGADNDWTGARFQAGTSTITSDTAMQRIAGDLNYFGQVEDGAAILMRLSTKDTENATLGFDWRTSSASGEDRFIAGYYAGFEASPDWANWTELLAGAPSTTWAAALYDLPSNEDDLWLAFWMKASEGDYGWVDNINVSGEKIAGGEPVGGDTVVPEPLSLVLLGAGLLAARRRS
jgi:hypothetical protein